MPKHRTEYGNIKIAWNIYLMHRTEDGRIVETKTQKFTAGPQVEAIKISVDIATRWVKKLKKEGKKGSVVWEIAYMMDLFGYYKILGLNGGNYNAEISI